jgi:hypothetical protein
MDPDSTRILTLDGGKRILAMAQLVGHHVAPGFASDGAPQLVTDGFKGDMTALLTHDGHELQPERKRAQGPAPKPHGRLRPGLLDAHVVKSSRRRRSVRVTPRVVCGTLEAVKQGLATRGWQMNTAGVERLHGDLRPPVAALGRRVTTVYTHDAGWRPQGALFHISPHCYWPHATLRRPLAKPEPTNGPGAARKWRPCTPAIAAGLTPQVWRGRKVVRLCVPPWPPPQAL